MDPIRLGRQFRALRIRKGLRQQDVGVAAKLSGPTISRIERGMIHGVAVGVLVRAAAAMGASVDIRLRWNGEQLDRLLDEAHARLVEAVVARLLVVGASDTSRRRVARLGATYDAAFPIRGSEIRRWIRDPRQPISGLLFVAYPRHGSAIVFAASRHRGRRRRKGWERLLFLAKAPTESVCARDPISVRSRAVGSSVMIAW